MTPSVAAAGAAAVPVPLLSAPWQVPGVAAVMSTRAGGVSAAPFDRLNLGRSVGDDPLAVAENRRRFVATLAQRGARPVWLRQVHGRDVLRLEAGTPEHPEAAADAAWTTERGVACLVGAADCLPVLLAHRDGRVVGAAHAGWRGLAAGVVEALVAAMCQGGGVPPGELHAWLAPCIGPRRFEVGADVLAAFGVEPAPHDTPRFVHRPRADGSARWLCDLQGLAADRLHACGVSAIEATAQCTVEDASRFFSFRRDRISGRMAAAIWRVRDGG